MNVPQRVALSLGVIAFLVAAVFALLPVHNPAGESFSGYKGCGPPLINVFRRYGRGAQGFFSSPGDPTPCARASFPNVKLAGVITAVDVVGLAAALAILRSPRRVR